MDRGLYSSLRQLKIKATPKRLAILDVLAGGTVYQSPEEVWQRLRKSFSKVGLSTIYRNLEGLSQAGVIMKIVHPDRRLYYYYCGNQTHHHHFVCVSCRKVTDLRFCGIRDVEKEVERDMKGRVLSHLLQVYGHCGECAGLA
jgi:Fe2+ or Zn2+ uptake regulation protein